jgi:hypothetical protein
MMASCYAYPHNVKEIIDGGDSNFKGVPLDSAVNNSEVLPILSTFLPVIVILYTPWTRDDSSPMYCSFCCGKVLSIRYIIDMPMRIDMGPAIIDRLPEGLSVPSMMLGRFP